MSNNSAEKLELIKLLRGLIEKLDNITEFSDSELKAISILENDEYLIELLKFYKLNKKHVRRKHSKELLEALRAIANSLNPPNFGLNGGAR